jgi:hypothetical protein
MLEGVGAVCDSLDAVVIRKFSWQFVGERHPHPPFAKYHHSWVAAQFGEALPFYIGYGAREEVQWRLLYW